MPPPQSPAPPDLHKRILAAIHYLEDRQKPNGAICDDEHPGFNVWETIIAARAIHAWSQAVHFEASPLFIKALHFLFKAENSDGMVYHNNSDEYPDTYCLETSAEYIQLLIELYPEIRPEIADKLAFVKSRQLDTGEWDIVNPTIPQDLQRFPSVIAYALQALACGDASPERETEAIEALLYAQHSEGHWGFNWMTYGTPHYALALVLDVLHAHRTDPLVSQSIGYAQKYILDGQHADGSWHIALKGFRRQSSAELQTALALLAARNSRLPAAAEAVQRGAAWLVDQQRPDGSWAGGYFPTPDDFVTDKQEDVYATAQVLLALHCCIY